MNDPFGEFHAFAISVGLDPGSIHETAKPVRFHVPGDKGRTKNGWYVFHADSIPNGVVATWKGERYAWRGERGGETIDREEIDRRREERRREDAKRFTQAALKAQRQWNEATKVNGSSHPYLDRKGIEPHGTRTANGNLLVPVHGPSGEIKALQWIPPEGGEKWFTKDCSTTGGFFVLGPRLTEGARRIVLCEGFATGGTIQRATGDSVVCSFNAANLTVVARWLKDRFPARTFLVAGDDDWQLPTREKPLPNWGRVKALEAAAILDCPAVFPDVNGADGQSDFNDQAADMGLASVAGLFAHAEPIEPKLVNATAFAWRPTAQIPKRQWLYGRHLLRKFVSLDVAAGGIGKSSLKIGEALAMASGVDFYDKGLPEGPLRVWLWNLEDPHEEQERRLHATAIRFNISPEQIADRLYVDSGRDQPLVTATEGPNGAVIARPTVDALILEMLERKIDVLQVDPFVSSHEVSENDNNAIDIVVKEWNVVAERTGAAINLVHHVRKGNGIEATADSARGASSLIGKARSVLVYNRMTAEECDRLGVASEERFFYFRVDNDKANLAPPERGDWYRMNNVDLPNGDSVGVACAWTPPDLFEGITVQHLYRVQKAIADGDWREAVQSKAAWAGHAVAGVLNLDMASDRDRKKVSRILKAWIAEGALEIIEKDDSKRMTRKFVVVGKWVEI